MTISEQLVQCLPPNHLGEVARAVGLELLGWSPLEALSVERDRLQAWQAQGHAGEMRYMLREPELLADVRRLLPPGADPACWALLSVMLMHSREVAPERQSGFGRVARYAWGRDYHRIMRKRLMRLGAEIARVCGSPVRWRAFADAVPMLERAHAQRAGLGFIGKNGLVIVPGQGSFGVLGELLCEVRVQERGGLRVVRDDAGCGGCSRCLAECPTNAFVAPYQLDARRCISYLTIEKQGMFTVAERSMVGDWLFGCDRCQEVCPFNHTPLKVQAEPDDERFLSVAGAGPLLGLAELLTVESEQAFLSRFAGTPLMRPGRQGMLRNAACVAVNTKVVELLPLLRQRLQCEPDPVVRAHLLWSIVCLGECEGSLAAATLLDAARNDPAAEVQAELQQLQTFR